MSNLIPLRPHDADGQASGIKQWEEVNNIASWDSGLAEARFSESHPTVVLVNDMKVTKVSHKKLTHNQLIKKLTWLYAVCRLPLPHGAKPKHRQLFLHLAMLSNTLTDASCTSSYRYLALVTGYGITSIKEMLDDLIEWELITKTARFNNSNVYHLHWEQLDGAQEVLQAIEKQFAEDEITSSIRSEKAQGSSPGNRIAPNIADSPIADAPIEDTSIVDEPIGDACKQLYIGQPGRPLMPLNSPGPPNSPSTYNSALADASADSISNAPVPPLKPFNASKPESSAEPSQNQTEGASGVADNIRKSGKSHNSYSGTETGQSQTSAFVGPFRRDKPADPEKPQSFKPIAPRPFVRGK
jgi:hypothetical protein